MERVYNFSAGPSALPLAVLQEAAADFYDIAGTGKSVMETSHRSQEYAAINQQAQALVKELLGLGDEYKVLLLSGGASLQFAMVPMNLLKPDATADYLVTGSWASKAAKEGKVIGRINIAADTGQDGVYCRVPNQQECKLSANGAYVHLTANNTIFGTQYHSYPQTEAPLVADMSSDIMSRPFDAKRFGLIYAGAQKNLGPAGVTLVVIREDLLQQSNSGLPSMLSYKTHADKDSLYNTPPCFNVYMLGRTLAWVKAQGGLEGMAQRTQRKADLLYQAIDQNPDFFRAPVDRESRSTMNVVFRLPTEDLEKRFVEQGKSAKMIGLKGHRSVGGIRVSIYNGVEPEWVEALVQFMEEFARRA